MAGDVQQGDVYLFQTNDNGEINVVDGIVEMRGSLETMAYLCLFGGNFEDDGSAGNSQTWWGNLGENEPSKQYVSRTQNILRGLPLSSSNLNRVNEAVLLDLQVFLDENIATSVDVESSIPSVDRVQIDININADGREQQISFELNWFRDIEANS